MPSEHATRSTLLRMFQMFDDGTADSYGSDDFLLLVADRCDWREDSTDPRFAGRQGNKVALRDGFEQSARTLRDRHAQIHEMDVTHDRALVRWTWSARTAAEGRRMRADVVSEFLVNGGLIVRWHDRIAVEENESPKA